MAAVATETMRISAREDGEVLSFSIGTAAKESGVSAKMIRYYESIGLIAPVARQHQGYRRYTESDVHTLRFINLTRSLGFSLEEVCKLLDLWRDRTRSAAAVETLVERQLKALSWKREELRAMQRTLEDLVERCDAGDPADCRCPTLPRWTDE